MATESQNRAPDKNRVPVAKTESQNRAPDKNRVPKSSPGLATRGSKNLAGLSLNWSAGLIIGANQGNSGRGLSQAPPVPDWAGKRPTIYDFRSHGHTKPFETKGFEVEHVRRRPIGWHNAPPPFARSLGGRRFIWGRSGLCIFTGRSEMGGGKMKGRGRFWQSGPVSDAPPLSIRTQQPLPKAPAGFVCIL
jgi:hypothetical protein